MISRLPLLHRYHHFVIPACLLGMTGTLVAYGTSLPQAFWLGWTGVTFVLMCLCLFLGARKDETKWFFGLFCFLVGGSYLVLFSFTPGPEDVAHLAGGHSVQMAGTLVSLGSGPDQWVMETHQVNGHQVTGQILLRFKPTVHLDSPLFIGDRLRVTGRLERPMTAMFPGDFDYRAYLYQQKMTALVFATAYQVAPETSASSWLRLLRFTDHLRLRVSEHFKRHLPSPEGDIFASVVLGEHATGIDNAVKLDFIHSGLIHTLAASGMNVGIIGFFFLLLGRWTRLPLRVSLVIAMLGVALYCLIAGLPPSVQRAGLMLELAFLLKMLDKQLSPVALLCITGAILTAINPMIVAMPGFQLSFLSTFGLMVMVNPLQHWLGQHTYPWLAGLLLVPLVAQLWVTPILLLDFNQMQLLSVPANLAAVPLVAILTYLGFILGGLSLVAPGLSGWLIHDVEFLCTGLKSIAGFFGNLPMAVITLASPPVAMIGLMFVLLMVAAYVLNHPHQMSRKGLIGALCAGVLLLCVPVSLAKWQTLSRIEITNIPGRYGQSCQVIRLHGDTVIVNITDFDSGMARALQSYLKHQGIAHVQIVNVMGDSVRRLPGLRTLAGTLQIEQVTAPVMSSPRVQDELIELSADTGIPVIPLAATQIVQGRNFKALFYNAGSGESLQRFQSGGVCFALHRGDKPLGQSVLVKTTQGCPIVQDTQPNRKTTMTFDTRQASWDERQYHRIMLTASHVHFENGFGS